MPATTRPRALVRLLGSTLRPKRLSSRRPSAHSVLGSAFLALAAVGAVASMQATQPTSPPSLKSSMQARLLDSPTTDRPNDALTARQGRVSRDSQREALEGTRHADTSAPPDGRDRRRDAAERAAKKRAADKDRGSQAWRRPVASGAYELTARFGQCSGLWSRCHTGLDFAAPTGTPVRSVATGTVTKVGYAGAYGLRTIVRLDDGTRVWYGHQNSTSVVPRQRVRPGDRIGTVGATGNVTGPHLHLEVHRRGRGPVDPHAALTANNVRP